MAHKEGDSGSDPKVVGGVDFEDDTSEKSRLSAQPPPPPPSGK
ncbi:hypothetical protein SLEP1_g17599 [Rubroshorea leprosula]|uniref:Uncharacterized protein n=1 Tax=Rubroshorea leprosula TaxID=152421 RepID=A0AAV5J3P6_9ROSI|nr:hypothetical protein SLEP1_g17599 [Rubroshorea leprosula]